MQKMFVILVVSLMLSVLPSWADNNKSATPSKLKALQEENAQLREENARLRKELATSASSGVSEALTALKKFQSRCDVGISYRDYAGALADVNYAVKEYLESTQATNNPDVAKSIRAAYMHYEIAGELWKLVLSQHSEFRNLIFPGTGIWKAFIAGYPEASYLMKTTQNTTSAWFPDMLSYIWGKAAENIDKVRDLVPRR